MINVKLQFIVVCVDIFSQNHRFLMDDTGNIISVDLSDSNIFAYLAKLTEEYLQTSAEWLEYRNVAIYDKDNTLHIVYAILIPEIITNFKGKWTNIGEINDKLVKEILYNAAQIL